MNLALKYSRIQLRSLSRMLQIYNIQVFGSMAITEIEAHLFEELKKVVRENRSNLEEDHSCVQTQKSGYAIYVRNSPTQSCLLVDFLIDPATLFYMENSDQLRHLYDDDTAVFLL